MQSKSPPRTVSTRNGALRAGSLGLAALFLISALAILPSPVHAAPSVFEMQAVPGCHEIGLTQRMTSRDVGFRVPVITSGTVTSPGITQVTFSFTPSTDPKTKDFIVWEGGELYGWDVEWQNRVSPYTLTFTSKDPANFYLPFGATGTELLFHIMFSVYGKFTADIPIGIDGKSADGQNLIEHSEYCLVPDKVAPTLLRAEGFDRTGFAPYRRDPTEFQPPATIDLPQFDAPSYVAGADLPDGRIDQVEITFDQEIDPTTFSKDQFVIGDPLDPYAIWNYERLPVINIPPCQVGVTHEARCSMYRFYLTEKSAFDGGKMPLLTYTQGTITDFAGNLMKSKSAKNAPLVADRIPPMLVGATAYHTGDIGGKFLEPEGAETYEAVMVTFSEPVMTGQPGRSANPDCGTGKTTEDSLNENDFYWVDKAILNTDALKSNPTMTKQGLQVLTGQPDSAYNQATSGVFKGTVCHPFCTPEDTSIATCDWDKALFIIGQTTIKAVKGTDLVLGTTTKFNCPFLNPLKDPYRVPPYTSETIPSSSPPNYICPLTAPIDDPATPNFDEGSQNEVDDSPRFNQVDPETGINEHIGEAICYQGKAGYGAIATTTPGVNFQGETIMSFSATWDQKTGPERVGDPDSGAPLSAVRLPRGISPSDGERPWCVRIHIPGVESVLANIDDDRVVVKFNTPMDDFPQNAIDVVPTTVDEGCPQGRTGLTFSRGSDIAFVDMDDVACPTDVDNTPSFIRVANGKVPGINQADIMQIYSPRSSFAKTVPEGENAPGYITGLDSRMLDLEPPRIVASHSVDTDGNGAIDGMFLQFSERINDASFCAQSGNPPPPFLCDAPASDTVGAQTTGYTVKMLMPPGVQPVSCGHAGDGQTAFSWDSDLAVNDRFGVIKWLIDSPLDAGTRCTVPELAFEGLNQWVPHDTGVVPDMTTPLNAFESGLGLFSDQMIQINPASISKDLSFIGLKATNVMDPVREWDVHETDGAAPVIVAATTVDSGTNFGFKEALPTALAAVIDGNGPANGQCMISRPGTVLPPICRDDGDGRLDEYRLVLSEPVKTGTFDPTFWKAGGKAATGAYSGNREGDVLNGRILHVMFPSGNVGDTDAKPELVMNRTPNVDVTVRDPQVTQPPKPGLKDRNGVPMVSFDQSDLAEKDGARPVITAIDGVIGADQLVVTFSEPVDDGSAGSLVRDDFTYINDVTKGVVSGFHSNREVRHKAGDKEATIYLEQALTEDDLKTDRIAAKSSAFADPQLCCIFESAPSVEKPLRQPALNYPHGLAEAEDKTPPGVISDVKIDEVTSNSVRLFWTAPGDDNYENGTITNYTLKVSKTPIILDNGTSVFDSVTAPGADIDVTYLLPNGKYAGPGETQQATVTGLSVRTTYYFAVVATDEAGNTGAVSNQQQAETLEDITAPPCTVKITSKTHVDKANVFTQKLDATFDWTAVTDPESTIVYHYKLDERDDYGVVLGDQRTTDLTASVKIPGDGTWYFYVRPFSGAGGASCSARFGPINVGYSPLDIADIRTSNQALQATTFANATKDGVTVEWHLPAGQPIGELRAIEIYKLDKTRNAWGKVHVVSGDLSSLRAGNYTDVNGVAGDKYLVLQVFAEGQKDPQPSTASYEGVSAKGHKDRVLPGWLFILFGVCLALIVSGLIIFLVLRRRRDDEVRKGAVAYNWEDAAGADKGVDPASGLPIHDVQCPVCAVQFDVIGRFPLNVTCPSCGANGTIEEPFGGADASAAA